MHLKLNKQTMCKVMYELRFIGVLLDKVWF